MKAKYKIEFTLNDHGEKQVKIYEDLGFFGGWGWGFLKGFYAFSGNSDGLLGEALNWVEESILNKGLNSSWGKRKDIYLNIHGDRL